MSKKNIFHLSFFIAGPGVLRGGYWYDFLPTINWGLFSKSEVNGCLKLHVWLSMTAHLVDTRCQRVKVMDFWSRVTSVC